MKQDSIRILLVEDEALVAMDLQEQLRRLGYTDIHLCRSGEDALLLFEAHRFEVVLMDIHLAGEWSGIETARRIQAVGPTAILYITDDTTDPIWEQAAATEPRQLLYKPVDALSLSRNIALAVRNTPVAQGASSPAVEDSIMVPVGHDEVRVYFAQILHLRAQGSYCEIYLQRQPTPLLISHHLAWVLRLLHQQPQGQRIRQIQRSHAVHVDQIERIQGNQVFLKGVAKAIPLGPSYRRSLRAAFPYLRQASSNET